MHFESSSCNGPLKVLGDYWTLRIVDALQETELRFCELQRSLPESNPATLTCRLKRMQEAGLLERKEETVDKQSVTYNLSKTGRALLPIVREIKLFTAGANGLLQQ